MNQRAIVISWNAFFLIAVLAIATFAPVWPTELGAAVALVLSRVGPPAWRHDLGLRKPVRVVATLAAGVIGGIILFFLVKVFLQHLCEIVTHSQRDLSSFDFARGHLLENVPLIMRTAVVAGVGEEIIYRGTVISCLEAIFPKNRITRIIILLFSAVFFGAAHAYQAPAGILVTALMGLLFGFIYLACGRRLWTVILMHTVYDLLALTAISSNLDHVLQAWSLALFRWFGMS